MTVTVLSKPACIQCTATYRGLDNAEVGYDTADIYEPTNLDLIKELGYMAAPVVLVRDADGNLVDHWAGFNHGKIGELATKLKAA